jgi:hypothetical protein
LETTIALARKFQPPSMPHQSDHHQQQDDQDIQISLNAVTGITTSQTMQVQLSINGHDFLALLDSRSTHNVIDSDIADDLNLQRTSALNSLKVAVANGDQISNVGIYNNLPVQIATESFIIDCYSIKLGGYSFVSIS